MPISKYFRAILLSVSFVAFASIAKAADFQLVETLAHQPKTFTQGLEFNRDRLYESSGLFGQSFLQYTKQDGHYRRHNLEKSLFAEGLTILNNRLYVLTWKAGRCLILDPDTLEVREERRYRGEGWGLTNNGRHLIMSNGSSYLSFIDPEAWQLVRQVQVHYRGKPVRWLNELEWHNGLILANQWQTNHILVIDARTGQVLKIIELTSLYPPEERPASVDVMNGIAYDQETDTWLITGKYWPHLYRLRLELPDIRPVTQSHQSSSR